MGDKSQSVIKKVFIFGARASRGAQEAQKTEQGETHGAPLVNDLFLRPYQAAAYPILSQSDLGRCAQECEEAIIQE